MSQYRCRRCKESVHWDVQKCPHCNFSPNSAKVSGSAKGLASVALQGATGGLLGRGLQEDATDELEASRLGVAEEVPPSER